MVSSQLVWAPWEVRAWGLPGVPQMHAHLYLLLPFITLYTTAMLGPLLGANAILKPLEETSATQTDTFNTEFWVAVPGCGQGVGSDILAWG